MRGTSDGGLSDLAAAHAWRSLAAAHGLGALDMDTVHRGASPNTDGVAVMAPISVTAPETTAAGNPGAQEGGEE